MSFSPESRKRWSERGAQPSRKWLKITIKTFFASYTTFPPLFSCIAYKTNTLKDISV
jgi:hypothetical protein